MQIEDIANALKASALTPDLANESNIVLLKSSYSLFRISGILFTKGLKPLF